LASKTPFLLFFRCGPATGLYIWVGRAKCPQEMAGIHPAFLRFKMPSSKLKPRKAGRSVSPKFAAWITILSMIFGKIVTVAALWQP
jgi:hypothetical protein